MATRDALNSAPKQYPSVPSRFFTPERILFLVLFLLSLGGIGVSDFSLDVGFWYWLVMVPIFACASIYHAWGESTKRGEPWKGVLVRLILHWAAMLAAVYLVYLLQHAGRISQGDAGLILLLTLSLTVFLGGIHFNWRFAVLGVILGGTVAMAALVEKYLWLMVVPVIVGALLVVFWKTAASKK